GRRPALDVPHDQGGAIERWHGFEGRAQDEPYVDAPGGVVDGDGPVDDGARMASVSVEYREHLIESELETLTAPAPRLLEGRIGRGSNRPTIRGRTRPGPCRSCKSRSRPRLGRLPPHQRRWP